jgi:RNA polymerase sigma factor (sigma-70 family)
MIDPASRQASQGAATRPKTMIDDHELLRRYAEEGAEEAFAELVHRHVNLVYSAARRQLNGDAHLAADAAQLVFTDLARKANSLLGHRLLAGWLFTSTRYAARNLVRTEQRRHAREQEAFRMDTMNRDDDPPPLDWQQVRPVLDDALGGLSEADREAILMRYFEGRDYAGVGAKLNVNDNTARMRVERALDKLRGQLERRGVTSTSAALAAALASQSVLAAPAGLAATVVGAALAAATGAGIAGGVAAGTTGAAISFMSMTKLQVGLAGALAVAGATGYIVQSETSSALGKEIAALQSDSRQVAALEVENARLARAAAEREDLQANEAALARLRAEAAALKAQQEALAAASRRLPAGPPARSAVTGPVYDITKVSPTPLAKSQVRPRYPAEMRQAGANGEVVVDFIVDFKGDVHDPYALRSSRPEFEAAAIEAVGQWKFAPGQMDGKTVNTRIQIPIIFTLNNGSAASPAPGGARPAATSNLPWF